VFQVVPRRGCTQSCSLRATLIVAARPTITSRLDQAPQLYWLLPEVALIVVVGATLSLLHPLPCRGCRRTSTRRAAQDAGDPQGYAVRTDGRGVKSTRMLHLPGPVK